MYMVICSTHNLISSKQLHWQDTPKARINTPIILSECGGIGLNKKWWIIGIQKPELGIQGAKQSSNKLQDYHIALLEMSLKTFPSVSSFRWSRLSTFRASLILVLSPRCSIWADFLWLSSLCKISDNSFGKPKLFCPRLCSNHLPHSWTFLGGSIMAPPISYAWINSIFTPCVPKSRTESVYPSLYRNAENAAYIWFIDFPGVSPNRGLSPSIKNPSKPPSSYKRGLSSNPSREFVCDRPHAIAIAPIFLSLWSKTQVAARILHKRPIMRRKEAKRLWNHA